jgi:hypothetical protein
MQIELFGLAVMLILVVLLLATRDNDLQRQNDYLRRQNRMLLEELGNENYNSGCEWFLVLIVGFGFLMTMMYAFFVSPG